MNIHVVKMLIEEGEGFEIELKRKVSSPEKIARTLCAFANTRGGTMLFGVDDDGTMVGVDSEKTEIDQIREAGDFHCVPPVPLHVQFVPYHHRDIIVVSVDESDRKPHAVTGQDGERIVYIRVEDNSVIASKEVIKVLKDEVSEKELVLAIGSNEQRLFDFLERHHRITVQEFAELINVSRRRASRILTTLVRAGVIRIHTLERSDYFTLAANDVLSSDTQIKQSRMQRKR
jgi:predicted HTH transcriptional regulator